MKTVKKTTRSIPSNLTHGGRWGNSAICLASVAVLAATLAPAAFSGGDCLMAANMCEVHKAIDEAKLAPSPTSPYPAVVSLAVTSVTSLVPNAGTAPQPYHYTVTNTINGSAANISAPLSVVCTPTPLYYIYTGGAVASGATASLATFNTTTPGTTCPLGTATCGTPANITISLPITGTASVTDTNYNTEFTSSNNGWDAYVTGSYSCTYTDPNIGFSVTQIVPWGQSS
jgi:hypothetical protein